MNHGAEALSTNTGASEAKTEKSVNIRPLQRALVIETLCDPTRRGEPPVSPDGTLDPNQVPFFESAPRNSIICRIITDENNKSEDSDVIAYPFFSSHLALPVKPGEQVWLFNEKPLQDNTNSNFFGCHVLLVNCN